MGEGEGEGEGGGDDVRREEEDEDEEEEDSDLEPTVLMRQRPIAAAAMIARHVQMEPPATTAGRE